MSDTQLRSRSEVVCFHRTSYNGEKISASHMDRIISLKYLIIIFLLSVETKSTSVVHALPSKSQTAISPSKLLESGVSKKVSPKIDIPKYDIPITYNSKVRYWVNYFQGEGRNWFKLRMERSYRYLPLMQAHMTDRGIPEDLAYVSMIESGFSPHATSEADAVGYWQFIKPTASRYGLRINWWIDERRDFTKSSRAAAAYLSDLYKMFNSWYLTAAAYNMGEGRLKRLIAQHKTDNFWVLSKKRNFPDETRDYIPKLIAAMLIAKNPQLYGFREIQPMSPYSYEYFSVPGGTDLFQLAKFIGVKKEDLRIINPELVHGFIPSFVGNHRIRIPKGTTTHVSEYVRGQLQKNL